MKILLLIFAVLSTAGLLAGQTPTPKPIATPPNVRVVRAQAGDTVTKVAERYGANPVEVAKYNGLLPNSVLGVGREIKLPGRNIYLKPIYVTPSTKRETSLCFSDQKIELTTTALPANFHGYDVRKIVELLEARTNLVKDEFETTAQFLERREKDQKKPLLGNIDLNSLLFFEVDGSFKYDADREEMHVAFEIPNWNEMQSPICDDSSGKYRNAGVKVNFADKPSANFDKKTWNYTFPVKLSDARLLKPNLRLLLVATLGDYLGSAFTYESKTYPYESYKVISLKLTGFWIFNVKSGAVLSKQEVKFSDVLPPKVKYADSVAQAKELYSQGKDEEALAVVLRVLADEPMNAESYLLIGKLHLRRGDIDQALSAFKTAVFWDNRLIEAHVLIGTIHVSKGDCLQAKNYAASAMEIDSDNSEAISLLRAAERCSR